MSNATHTGLNSQAGTTVEEGPTRISIRQTVRSAVERPTIGPFDEFGAYDAVYELSVDATLAHVEEAV